MSANKSLEIDEKDQTLQQLATNDGAETSSSSFENKRGRCAWAPNCKQISHHHYMFS